jgi:hypothetical protein
MKLTSKQYADAVALGFYSHWYRGGLSPFGEACFDDSKFDEIKNCATAELDEFDMQAWDIDERGWRKGQREAIEQAMHYYEAGKNTEQGAAGW